MIIAVIAFAIVCAGQTYVFIAALERMNNRAMFAVDRIADTYTTATRDIIDAFRPPDPLPVPSDADALAELAPVDLDAYDPTRLEDERLWYREDGDPFLDPSNPDRPTHMGIAPGEPLVPGLAREDPPLDVDL